MAAAEARERFLSILNSGRNIVGTMVTSVDPLITGIMASAGFDFTILDLEHGFMSLESAQRHVVAARAGGMTIVVRVLENTPHTIQSVLDIGAEGVVVPKVGTRQDAEVIAAAVRYGSGGRGACQGTFAADFTFDGWDDYVARTNRNVLAIPLIETRMGVENADEIAAVDGIDILFFGPVDFAQDSGCDFRDPIVTDAWRTVRDAAHRHGKLSLASTFTAEGADLLVDGMDLMFLRKAAADARSHHGARATSGTEA